MLKIRSSINSIKVLCLAAVTIATSIGNILTSHAEEAIRINIKSLPILGSVMFHIN